MIAIMSTNIIKSIRALRGSYVTLERDGRLFCQGDFVQSVFVVEDGLIELLRPHTDGRGILLQRAARHTVLAEASIYTDTYHCNAIASQPSQVYRVAKEDFLNHFNGHPQFAHQWTAYLAMSVQSARFRSEGLTLKTVAERLDGWLSWPSNTLPEKGQWMRLAAELGVSQEALYRELANRRSNSGAVST